MVGEFEVPRGFRLRVSIRVAATALLGRRQTLPWALAAAIVGVAGSALLAAQRYPAWALPGVGFCAVFLAIGIAMALAYLAALRRNDRYPAGGVVRVTIRDEQIVIFETNRRSIVVSNDESIAILQTFGYVRLFVGGEQFTDVPSEALPREIRAPHSVQFSPKRLF
ncbi:hypothetical protein [Mesorhizobium japonicum]|uniref:hypothetical protein n=1 Tax=Mesorhizobium japonicum TaxID=2066070 RepID=UPI003B5B2B6A